MGQREIMTGAVLELHQRDQAIELLRRTLTLREPQACRYFPESICGCGGRGTCLPAA